VASGGRGVIEGTLKLFEQLLNDWSRDLLSFIPAKQKYLEQKEYIESEVQYMRRFINNLLDASNANEDMPQNLDTHLHITVTTDQLKVLQQFGNDNKNEYIPSSPVADFRWSERVRSIYQIWQHV
jgi:hypothetical protein